MEGIMSLLNATEFAGFQIKEWNIVQFSKLSGILGEVAKEYKTKNISWESFSTAVSETSENGMLDISQGVLEALEPFTRHAPTILNISCKCTPDQLEKMPFTDGIVLLILVLKFNMEHLGRFFVQLVKTDSSVETTTVLN